MTKSRMIALLVATGITGLVAACVDTPVEPELPVASVRPQVSVDLMARGLAIALEQDDFRMQILEDMRDSPFPKHSLHLSSYLSGERGRSIMAAIAGGLGRETGAFAAALARSENVALHMNPAKFRMTWEGDPSVAVFPIHDGAVDESGMMVGYRPGGTEMRSEAFTQATFPGLLIESSLVDFGSDPETQRSSSSKHNRGTISTREEEFGEPGPLALSALAASPGCDEFSQEGCDPCLFDPSLPECQESSPSVPSIPGTGGFCWVAASSSGDADGDGLRDSCEHAIALAFAPRMRTSKRDPDETRESYWAARPTTNRYGDRLVKIFYAFAYHKDWGINGYGIGGHLGDSEYVAVTGRLLAPWTNQWYLYSVYLSAHEGTFFERSELVPAASYPEVMDGLAPVVWISWSKHANFRSEYVCDHSVPFEYCSNDRRSNNSPTEVRADANLGSYGRPLRSCQTSRWWWDRVNYHGVECFWWDMPFRGWWGADHNAPASAPYLGMLRNHGF